MRRYATHTPRWQFWWFQFRLTGAVPMPLDRMAVIPRMDWEEAEFALVTEHMRSPHAPERMHASALFGAMVYRWMAAWPDVAPPSGHRAVDAALRRMRESLHQPLSIAGLARACHLGERRFRQVFHEATGLSPKAYFNRLRLEAGREYLRMGVCNVGEAAARLGFSSQFHFSRAFRQRYGVPPSQA